MPSTTSNAPSLDLLLERFWEGAEDDSLANALNGDLDLAAEMLLLAERQDSEKLHRELLQADPHLRQNQAPDRALNAVLIWAKSKLQSAA
jgi:hypothetical protein